MVDRCLSFGPVPSRRLGRSLGVNNIPAKACSYSCVYCQVGRTTSLLVDRGPFYEPLEILRDVRQRLSKARRRSEQIDYLTFVPDGEPTLDINLGEEIRLLKELGLPVAVISNGSLLWQRNIRSELALADWVSLKVDAVRAGVWRTVNRPHPACGLPLVMNGMLEFASIFAGTLVTETMLVSGANDDEVSLAATAEFVRWLHPSRAYLSVPTRPPAEARVEAPSEVTVARAHETFANVVGEVECLVDYEGSTFHAIGDVVRDLLAIAAVHPMRADAVNELLAGSDASWEVVSELVSRGDLVEVRYGGHLYYVRRFPKTPEPEA